jgi:lysozyme family protein
MRTFDDDVAFVLEREGGYVFDPDDPGGETNMGISHRAYPDEDIKHLTRARAVELYKRDYWFKANCDALPEPLALVVFDTAVNMGVGKARDLLKASADWQAYLWNRADAYRQIVNSKPTSLKFLAGWLRRLVLLYREAATNGIV